MNAVEVKEEVESEDCRQSPTCQLRFSKTAGRVLEQMWDIETAHKHYSIDPISGRNYQYTSYTTRQEWRPVE